MAEDVNSVSDENPYIRIDEDGNEIKITKSEIDRKWFQLSNDGKISERKLREAFVLLKRV